MNSMINACIHSWNKLIKDVVKPYTHSTNELKKIMVNDYIYRIYSSQHSVIDCGVWVHRFRSFFLET